MPLKNLILPNSVTILIPMLKIKYNTFAYPPSNKF